MRTELSQAGRVIVIDEISSDTPQAFTVCIKDPSDWEEIHNYIINENEIDGIPNRRISCISEMQCSSKRSVYEMSFDEADVLRQHSKVEWVVKSSMHNPVVLEQRKYDEEFDRHATTDRFREDVRSLRGDYDLTGRPFNYTQWGLLRNHSVDNSPFRDSNVSTGTTYQPSDPGQYSLSGKNVDVVIMDTGVAWRHPEFLKPGVSSFVDKDSTRVRDILIHGASEYNINWANEGLVAPGSGTLSNYTVANALESSDFNGSWHGSHVAGTAAGNQFGAAFESNIWSIACIDRSDVGFSDPSDGFDYIRVWHKNKPINPETGRRNPTIVNGSWGFRQFVSLLSAYTVNYRGDTLSSTYVEASNNNVPQIYTMETNGYYYEFVSKHATSQTTVDELFDDADCDDVICVFAAGNSKDKQDMPGGDDYNNQFLTGTFYYGDTISEPYGSVDEYFNRPGTPSIVNIGQSDAPISVGALDSLMWISAAAAGITSESKASFSNTGPAIDVFAAGRHVLSPWNEDYGSGILFYADPRDTNYYNGYLQGTSMAAPNVCGVIACHLESIPSSTRVDVRDWLFRHGSVVIPSGMGTLFYDQYGATNPVGAGTSLNYWNDTYGLKGATARVLYNPYANNARPKYNNIEVSGISFKQS